jgi:hypothetical protein
VVRARTRFVEELLVLLAQSVLHSEEDISECKEMLLP